MTRRKGGLPARRGSVRRTPYGKYQARWYVTEWDAGTNKTASVRKTMNFDDEQSAYDHLDTVNTDLARGDYLDPDKANLPIAKVAEEWIATLTKRASTMANYNSRLHKNVLPFFNKGATPVGIITPHDVKKLIAYLAHKGLARGTIRNAISVLKMVLDTAVEMESRKDNPARAIKGSDYPEADYREMLFLTAEEVTQLANSARHPYQTLIYFAAYTGLRAGEIAALRMKNIDLLRNKISVTQTLSEVNGEVIFEKRPKNKKPRVVHMPKALTAMLNEYLNGEPQKSPEDFLFTGTPHRKYKEEELKLTREHYAIRHNGWFRAAIWEPALGASDIASTHPNLRFHDLRHTCAAMLIALGAHPKEICEHMGHSSIQVTMDRYGHLYPDAKEALMAKLDETFINAQNKELAERNNNVQPLHANS